jgi:toxin ParE1/3/4
LRRLIWSSPAIREIAAIADHYAETSPSLAADILRRIDEAPALLRERPLIGSPAGLRGARKWPVRKTPFILLYQVTADRDVEVLRVLHSARDWRAT